MMRPAEIAGDREAVLEWEARDVAEKQRRHERVMDWITSPIRLVKAGALAILSFTALLLGLGVVLAVADSDVSQVLAPIVGVIQAIRWTVWFLAAYGALLLLAATAGGVLYLWALGRRHTEPPAWVAPVRPAEGPARDVVPDEGAIMAALRNLNLAPLDKKVKEGWVPRWVQGTGRDGKGWRTQLELPPGVTVEMINSRKTVLAHNLVRLPVEVWPTEPKRQPGVLDLWVADQGLLTGPVEPYPLLTDGTTDYFAGVPVGIDQRGSTVTGRLMASNYGIAGIMGSGKTSLVIELLCGAMLDPLVDIDVYVMAYNVDYDPMRPRLRTLIKGDEDEHVIAAMEALRELRTEVTERGRLLAELGGEETKVTRALAEKDARLRPRVVVFDECQELFRHEEFGDEAKELAIKVMMKARKCAITLVFVTPAPSSANLPRDLAKTTSHSVCFAIGDHQGNDAILGTGAHKQGISATALVPGEDVGTAMATGFAARPGLLRTHHIRKEKGIDEITPIVTRAAALREQAGITPAPARPDAPAAPRVDPLADIAAVLGDTARIRTQEVLQRLTERRATVYRGWTFAKLTEVLAEVGAAPYKSGGHMVVATSTVHAALTERDRDSDEHEGTE
ncbi:cell division protein FtsK [Pseudonocardia sp. K10HN5]|uniref:Cell division protein FtsK n=2 Tax=Pseudonocardia acidicola TaxID=2724939 RepID=A0ABX1S5G8_9PSEU|nr:cell division protein FtsK [Pseudonocardia acidicola]